MKKTLSALLISGILLGTGVASVSAADPVDLGTKDGTTTLEITDYNVDPITKLPTDPGAFTLNAVPNIDFGAHSLDSIPASNATLPGTYSGDMNVTDTRPTQKSIDDAKAIIDGITPSADVSQDQIDASKALWDGAVAASPWKITAAATDLGGIGTSLKIGTTEIMGAGDEILSEVATTPVGTKSYLADLATPSLTLANNNLSVTLYQGSVTFTAVNAL